MVSSNHNEKVSEIISQVLMSVGLDGIMNIVESPTGENAFKLVNGLIFPRGLVSNNFVQDEAGGNKVEQVIEFDHPLVLVVADKISEVQEILPIMELAKNAKKPLVVFSMDLQDEPASTMVYNNLKGIVKCAAVNIPWSGGIELENLKDIATVTGAKLIDNKHEILLSEVKLSHFGKAKHIRVSEFDTSIVDGNCAREELNQRLDQIRQTIAEEPKHHLKNVHKERLARLECNIAEIQVGGASEVERGEQRDIIIDALNSAKSAI
jgi:chaperonin GroEL